MADIAIQNAEAYAARHGLLIAERLGFGIHGTIHVAEHKTKGDKSAIKAHREREAYLRERAVYERLKEKGISEILDLHVPQLIRTDDDWQVIEMTVVTRPFVLDFAGAYLDSRPEFAAEIWAEWEAEKQEQFGPRWERARAVLDAFEELGIYLVDVSPTNIAF
jgi:hypothetical protein